MRYTAIGQTGLSVSELALGAASLGAVYHAVSQTEANEAVATALDGGVTYIDVAPYYGLTRAETVLGIALSEVAREAFVLSSKIGRYGDQDWDFSRDATLKSFDQSCARLRVDHIDILQCHDIEYGDYAQLIDEALPALRDLKAQGAIKAIGLTGYDLALLEKVAIEQQVDTVMAYCTYTLQDQRLAPVARRLKDKGIAVFNASPLGMGLLTRKGPPDWHPGHDSVHAAARAVADLCEASGTDLSQLALQFALHTAEASGIASTVIGASRAKHMRGNIAAISQSPDSALLAKVEALLAPVRDKGWDVLPGNGGKAGK